MKKRKRHNPEQIVKKLRDANAMLTTRIQLRAKHILDLADAVM